MKYMYIYIYIYYYYVTNTNKCIATLEPHIGNVSVLIHSVVVQHLDAVIYKFQSYLNSE